MRTENLVLSLPGKDMAQEEHALFDILKQYRVSRMMGTVPFPYPREQLMRRLYGWVKFHQENGPIFVYIIREGKTDRILGTCGLSLLNQRSLLDIGYYLDPKFWGRGYITEAVGTLMQHASDKYSTLRIAQLDHFADNPASGRVAQKLGFTRTHRAMLTSAAREPGTYPGFVWRKRLR